MKGRIFDKSDCWVLCRRNMAYNGITGDFYASRFWIRLINGTSGRRYESESGLEFAVCYDDYKTFVRGLLRYKSFYDINGQGAFVVQNVYYTRAEIEKLGLHKC